MYSIHPSPPSGALLGMDIERMEQVALTDELRSFRTELFHACQNADQERGTDGVFHYEFPEETILPNGNVRSINRLNYKFSR